MDEASARPELAALFPGANAVLGEALEALRARGAAAWPGASLSEEQFVSYLAERLPAGAQTLEALQQLHSQDLYLACACLRGEKASRAHATRLFDERVLSLVPEMVARFDPTSAFAAEVQQSLRERLLVGTKEGGPRLLDYQGSGSLRAWLKVAAVRTALNLLLQRKRARATDTAAADEAAQIAIATPELRFIQLKYREPLSLSLREAFAALGEKERNLLRWAHVERLNLPAIGALYGVHKSTVSRWLSRACEKLLEETKRRAAERLSTSPSEMDSLLRTLRDQIDLSLSILIG